METATSLQSRAQEGYTRKIKERKIKKEIKCEGNEELGRKRIPFSSPRKKQLWMKRKLDLPHCCSQKKAPNSQIQHLPSPSTRDNLIFSMVYRINIFYMNV